MRQLLLNDSRRWWTVEEMAKECDMSVNHMRNLFKEQTGLSPKTFIENLKMRRAAERLSNTLEPISSIAADFSYLDPYHFSRVFKRIMGMSPKQYRIAQQR
jgi:AraC-like DNA-binding protein